MEEITHFWFSNPQIWFGCTVDVDEQIRDKYQSLFTSYEVDLEKDIVSNKQLILSEILLYDQLNRHIHRGNKEMIQLYDRYSLSLSIKIEPYLELYTPEERCFLLMPQRHTFQYDYLKKVLGYIQRWHHENPEISIYRRFYIATLQSYSKINTEYQAIDSYQPKVCTEEEIIEILDPISPKRLLSLSSIVTDSFDELIIKHFFMEMDKIVDTSNKTLIVSLSGGVDSMVCAYLTFLWNLSKNQEYRVVCVSIDYSNRPEQKIELSMVNQFCTLLKMEHYVREIDEIKRTRDSDREIYESITRDIRFDMYKQFGDQVILGHNKDDSLENVFSNIKKRRSYRNLYGMSSKSMEKDVHIFRPLLKIWKKDIIEFAQRHSIPFVYDSTPSWSERGKMRDILIPQMLTFSEEMVEGIFDMVDNFRDIYEIYESMIPHIEYKENQCDVEDKNIYFYEYMKKIVYMIQIHYDIRPIKNKSILNLCESLKMKNTNRITMSKEMIVQKRGDTLVFDIIPIVQRS